MVQYQPQYEIDSSPRTRFPGVRTAMILLLGGALSLGMALPVAPAAADEVAGGGAKVTTEQAKAAALKAVPGKVTDIGIERKQGRNVYVVEIVPDKDDDEVDVLVDPETGQILGTE